MVLCLSATNTHSLLLVHPTTVQVMQAVVTKQSEINRPVIQEGPFTIGVQFSFVYNSIL